ncbi:dUTP diphosphatase [Ureaplasma sp. ES3154-GEN]|uniref:dUTP diphosphatase n=1 Tax=Ureaplasma sp. ES3154-GEN TaxID=2984844 RepID=UPI0021E70114|nr:dUTP diphosphatase [Ureaplasma sp. ES3154-GEN]MCV3743492.1 dUTP diphosphatase [Ureaplasma sp. ES3154-GEN]
MANKELIMDFRHIFNLQKQLDETILKYANHDHLIDIARPRLLALLVEVGEFTNELQTFKYWKKQKQINQQKMLDELADVLHFAAAISLDLNVEPLIQAKIIDQDLTEQIIGIYNGISLLAQNYSKQNMTTVMQLIYGLCILLELDTQTITNAYKQKNQVNYQRVQSGY